MHCRIVTSIKLLMADGLLTNRGGSQSLLELRAFDFVSTTKIAPTILYLSTQLPEIYRTQLAWIHSAILIACWSFNNDKYSLKIKERHQTRRIFLLLLHYNSTRDLAESPPLYMTHNYTAFSSARNSTQKQDNLPCIPHLSPQIH